MAPINKWTKEQSKAIEEKGKDILVAAAAGSGKTAVLVERIIRKITDPNDQLNVDELLVATFTKAAAAEMKERIRESLEKIVFQEPENEHVRRQLALINRASITTLHSFCKDVIKRFYHTIDLDPSFRVANDTESVLIRQDVLDALMEEKYESMINGDMFWVMTEWFGGERDDAALFRLVQELYNASISHPDPFGWLQEMALLLDGPEAGDRWFSSLMVDVRLELQSILAILKDALQVATSPGGPTPYIDTLTNDMASVKTLITASETTWENLHQSFQMDVFKRLKPCKKDDYDMEMIQQVKDYRDAAKKVLLKVNEDLFKRSIEQYRSEMVSMAPIIRELIDLVTVFGERYQLAKKERNLVDFSDLEHFCLQVLSSELREGELVPSAAAISYKKQFKEVLLDEYQDTNRVQEAIITLISRQEPGNRFLVGDVKQSIYRFRLAEPGIFLEKYNRFPKEGSGDALRIDLARNFRSRREVINAANFIFRQIMSERVAEVPYDNDAELIYGSNYPEAPMEQGYEAELLLIDRDKGTEHSAYQETIGKDVGDYIQIEADDLEPARIEAKAVVQEINRLMGHTGDMKFQVFDKKLGELRPIAYRDIVILMRSTHASAPVFFEEFKLNGIPAHAELNTGYFTATEVETMIALLQIIDNPYQDIPLAAVLRSPMVGLSADDLANVRAKYRRGDFYEAVVKYAGEDLPSDQEQGDVLLSLKEVAAASEVPVTKNRDETALKISGFLKHLENWRTDAREGTLADLIWRIYRDTNYYDFIGGLPGGVQRQANLKALFDRARQYEATSYRGLFRFLRFIERMKEAGNDLGIAKSVGEQENVVRIMSIHKSKGLEFPVVFVVGMGKQFNQRDLNGHFLIHKELGFGPKFVDTDKRMCYPSLSYLAIKRRMRMEMLAEEMRVLYVALTRPKEKLYLVGAVRGLEKKINSWSKDIFQDELPLPDHELAKASSYIDWIGPALVRHPDAEVFRNVVALGKAGSLVSEESKWNIRIINASSLAQVTSLPAVSLVNENIKRERIDSVMNHRSISGTATDFKEAIESNFNWVYPMIEGSMIFSKTSVTELKRIGEINPTLRDSFGGNGNIPHFMMGDSESKGSTVISRRPRFMEERSVTAAERGTAFHTLLQNLHFYKGRITKTDIRDCLENLVDARLLTISQADAVDVDQIVQFFKQDIGKRILSSKKIMREVPFSYGLAAADVYPYISDEISEEVILIQGVIDCLFEVEEGLVLLDYKTDSTKGKTVDQLVEKYRLQISLYVRAIEKILKRPIVEKYLYFFDGGHLICLT